MNEETLKATVNYQDYEGTVAADGHDRKFLGDLAEKHEIDTNRYFIVGVKIRIAETRGDELATPQINLLTVDMQQTKAGSIDFIRQYAENNDNELPYQTFSINVSLEEVLGYFKRFELILLNRQLNRVSSFKNTDYD